MDSFNTIEDKLVELLALKPSCNYDASKRSQ